MLHLCCLASTISKALSGRDSDNLFNECLEVNNVFELCHLSQTMGAYRHEEARKPHKIRENVSIVVWG